MGYLLEEQRENWGTRGGFVLAAIGSAVGLGNLWGFPYKIYSHGGGAFLIPYIIAMFLIGIPMLMMEFSLGHFTQRAAPDAFRRTNRRLEFVGWWGIILGFVIITYYPVILSYCFTYLWYSIQGIFNGGELPWAGLGIEGVKNAENFFFSKYLNYTEGFDLGSLQMHLIWPLIITWVAMYLCIFKGVNLVGKIVWLTVPLPWLMLVILTVRGLTLDGAMQGLVYYLHPDWSQLLKPSTWTFAFGQAFFSLSLAFGVMVTYASFLHRKSDINNNAAIIGIADFATSFIAGLAVFATIGGMALASQNAGHAIGVKDVISDGPGLAFVAFPYALAQLPYSAWFSFTFFFALVTLGIDSAFSITESVLASVIDKTGWKRAFVLPAMTVIGFLLGLIYITNGGLNWLGEADKYINGTWGIAFLGLLECVAIGWFGNVEKLRKHANSRSDWKAGRWWNVLICIVIPVLLGALFFWNLFNDFTDKGGFFINAETGKLILPNIIGITVFVIIVPAVSIVMSIIKSPLQRSEDNNQPSMDLKVKGRLVATISLLFTLIPIVIYVCVFVRLIENPISSFWSVWLIASLLLNISSVIGANNMLLKHDTKTTRPSWKARWAGLVSSVSIGAFIAVYLISYTRYKVEVLSGDTITEPLQTSQHLTTVSYVILAFVMLLIFGGLAWCFFKAMTAANKEEPIQHPDEE